MLQLKQYSFEIKYLEEKQFTKYGKTKDYYGETFRKFYLDNLSECFDKWEFYLRLEKQHNIKILTSSIAQKTQLYMMGRLCPPFYNIQFVYNYEKTLDGMEYVGK